MVEVLFHGMMARSCRLQRVWADDTGVWNGVFAALHFGLPDEPLLFADCLCMYDCSRRPPRWMCASLVFFLYLDQPQLWSMCYHVNFQTILKRNTLSTLFTVEMSDGNRLYYKTCFALFTVVMRDMRDGEGVAHASLVLHLGYIWTSHNYHVNFNTFHTLYSWDDRWEEGVACASLVPLLGYIWTSHSFGGNPKMGINNPTNKIPQSKPGHVLGTK